MREKTRTKLRIAVIDFETDPFKHGRIPKPFCAGFYTEGMSESLIFWGDDCADQLGVYLANIKEPTLIYAHNGGRFDFHFLWRYFGMWKYEEGRCNLKNRPIKWVNDVKSIQPLIINGRIVEVKIGRCTLRDSFSAIPCALSKFGEKLDIDYRKLEADVRDQHRDEIVTYLNMDCISLWRVMDGFQNTFGDYLTVGSAALAQLTAIHPWGKLTAYKDREIRPFYMGGRVQCFEEGIIQGNFSMYDINSQYPYSMANFAHPTGDVYYNDGVLNEQTDFVEFRGTTLKSCLPVKDKTGLNFPVGEGFYRCTGHEARTALELGLVKIDRIIRTITFVEKITFDKFVETFYAKRKMAILAKDVMYGIFYKFIMNSAYGKFGQNPDNWNETWICYADDDTPHPTMMEEPDNPDAWVCKWSSAFDDDTCVFVWERPTPSKTFNNVATAASITGAARSVLMRGLALSDRPLYCDTDSIICEQFHGNVSKTELGAFKHEADLDLVAIHGKKMYAGFKDDICVKHAAKGTVLTPADIVGLCRGVDAISRQPGPCFSFVKPPTFVTRTIKARKDTENV